MKQVVLIGRMNVGKSSLFNRLTETHHAIVSTLPGTTRDARRGVVTWRGLELSLVDTGGVDLEADEQLQDRVIAMSYQAMEKADLVLFVVDGQVGLLPQDRTLATTVKQSGKPVLMLVNKIDRPANRDIIPDNVHQLPFEAIPLSAKNGRGTGDLLDRIVELLNPDTEVGSSESRIKLAIVGRPNVGKSSLLNSILGEERVIAADLPHTTRDSNDIPFDYKDQRLMLIDTAGIRRQSRVGNWNDQRIGQIEKASVHQAMTAIQRADVTICVVEAQKRIDQQDKRILQLAADHGHGVLLVINKWDLVEEKDADTINEYIRYFQEALPFLHWAPMIFISAKDSLRVKNVLDLALQVVANNHRTVPQEILDEALDSVRPRYHPAKGKVVSQLHRLLQVGTRPPSFTFSVSRPKDIPKAIMHMLENEIRDRSDFDGVKMRIEIVKKV